MVWEIRKRFKDKEGRKVFKGVLDDYTLLTLYKLSNKGYFDLLYGFIKQGKESNILLGEKNGERVAIKVHAVTAGNFKRIHPYIIGDERFKHIKKDRRSIIFAWCKKEFKNLKIAEKADVACPKPIVQLKNVLVMEFLGENFTPAPRLCDIILENPKKVFRKVIEYIERLYKNSLIHGDLSPYNVLLFKNKPYFIDFSQGVLKTHPNAELFLRRDIKNVCIYFRKYDIECQEDDIYSRIVDML